MVQGSYVLWSQTRNCDLGVLIFLHRKKLWRKRQTPRSNIMVIIVKQFHVIFFFSKQKPWSQTINCVQISRRRHCCRQFLVWTSDSGSSAWQCHNTCHPVTLIVTMSPVLSLSKASAQMCALLLPKPTPLILSTRTICTFFAKLYLSRRKNE